MRTRSHPDDMKKRVLSAALWFYAGWTLGAFLAMALSISPFVGPILGAAAAGIVAGDPRRLIWKQSATKPTMESSALRA